MNECIALVHDAIIYNSFFQLLLVTMLRTMPWPCNSCFCYLYSKLKLICCHCWGGQCAVKKVKRKGCGKASRPSDSWVSNARTVIAISQTYMIVTANIKMHRVHLAAMNTTNPRSPFMRVQAWPLVFWDNIAWRNWVSGLRSNNHQIIIEIIIK